MEKNKYPNRLKEIRKKSRYTQDDLAGALRFSGVDPDANKQKIYKIEQGIQQMTSKEALALASFLEVNVEELYSPLAPSAARQPIQIKADEPEINNSLDALLSLYTRSTPDVQKHFKVIINSCDADDKKLKKNNG